MGAVLATVVATSLLAILLSAAERVDPEDRNPIRSTPRGSFVDAGWFAVYLGYAPLTATGTMALVAMIAPLGPAHGAVGRWPVAWQIAGALVVADFVAYWVHRAMHGVPALWILHRVHHGATDVRWWTTFRFHPIDGAAAHALPLVVAAACGFGPAALTGYVAVLFVVTVFAHADVWIPVPFATRLIALPAFHRTHHEVGRDRANFAVVLTVWDSLFGTAAHGFADRRFGIDGPRSEAESQCRTASPTASDATLAMQLNRNAGPAGARPPFHTSTASR